MATVQTNKQLMIGLLVNVRGKFPFAKKKIEMVTELGCAVNFESYLDIPTFIRQGRVLSHL